VKYCLQKSAKNSSNRPKLERQISKSEVSEIPEKNLKKFQEAKTIAQQGSGGIKGDL
jgi:hypothetical protein